MTRDISSQGPSIRAALIDAIAELAGCDPEKVELELSAPGLDTVAGRVRFELDVVAPASEPAGEPEETTGEEQPVGVETIDPAELDEEAEAAADFLEGLLDAMDLPGDLQIRIKDEHAEVEVIEVGSGALIGRRGQTLEAVQELVRCALQRQFERRARVQVDVEGYRARRLEKLVEKAEEAIDKVLETGEAERLEPMDVFERKVVHQRVAKVDGLTSRSQGREPGRRVVIEPS